MLEEGPVAGFISMVGQVCSSCRGACPCTVIIRGGCTPRFAPGSLRRGCICACPVSTHCQFITLCILLKIIYQLVRMCNRCCLNVSSEHPPRRGGDSACGRPCARQAVHLRVTRQVRKSELCKAHHLQWAVAMRFENGHGDTPPSWRTVQPRLIDPRSATVLYSTSDVRLELPLGRCSRGPAGD